MPRGFYHDLGVLFLMTLAAFAIIGLFALLTWIAEKIYRRK